MTLHTIDQSFEFEDLRDGDIQERSYYRLPCRLTCILQGTYCITPIACTLAVERSLIVPATLFRPLPLSFSRVGFVLGTVMRGCLRLIYTYDWDPLGQGEVVACGSRSLIAVCGCAYVTSNMLLAGGASVADSHLHTGSQAT